VDLANVISLTPTANFSEVIVAFLIEVLLECSNNPSLNPYNMVCITRLGYYFEGIFQAESQINFQLLRCYLRSLRDIFRQKSGRGVLECCL